MCSLGFCALGILLSAAFAAGCEGEHFQNIAVRCSEKQLCVHLQSCKFSDVWFPFPFCMRIQQNSMIVISVLLAAVLPLHSIRILLCSKAMLQFVIHVDLSVQCSSPEVPINSNERAVKSVTISKFISFVGEYIASLNGSAWRTIPFPDRSFVRHLRYNVIQEH